MATNNNINNAVSYLELPQNGFAPSPSTGGVLAVSAGDRPYYNNSTDTYGLPLVNNGGGGAEEGDLLLGNSAGNFALLNIGTSGYVLTAGATTASWEPTGGGTVTSVGLTQGASDFTISGSPVTISGDISITLNTVGIAKGGTGQTTKAPAFDALSPTTTSGDLSYRGDTANIRLGTGTLGQVLKVLDATAGAVVLGWATPTVGTVTSVTFASPNTNSILSGTNPITSSGTITLDVGAPVYWNAARTSFTIGPKNLPQTGDSNDLYIINTIGLPSAVAGAPFSLVAFGRNALGAITTGNENTAVGNGTLQSLTTGYSNVGMGTGCMYNAVAAHDNTGIGHNSLQSNATTSFNVVAIGTNAGGTPDGLTSYNNNTFLGANTAIGGSSVTPAYRTAIGSAAIVGDDNLVQLGHLEAVGLGLYGSTAPSAFSTGGDTYAGFSIINPTGSVYQLALTGRSGVSGLSGLIPIMTTTNANVTGTILVGNGTNYAPLVIGASGTALTSNGTTASWTALAGTGTVTSVAVTSSDLTVGGSPITGAGTITLALANAYPKLTANGGGAGTVDQATIPASASSVTVSTSAVLTGSRIFLTIAGFTGTASLALGTVSVSNIVNGVSFDINIATAVPILSSALVNWFIINP